MATTRRAAFVALAVAATIALAGCVPTSPMPTPTESGSSTPTPTPTKAPKLNPAGSAEDNIRYWQYVVKSIYDAHGMPDGATVIQRLVEAGFDKAAMEITPDLTAISEPVDSIVFSVRFNGSCLVGQIFPYSWNGVTAPILGTGTCLVGVTRPIDF